MELRIWGCLGPKNVNEDYHSNRKQPYYCTKRQMCNNNKKQSEVIIIQCMRVWWLGSSGQHGASDGWSVELKFSKVYANKQWLRWKRQRIADWNLIVSPQEEKLQANISSSALEEKLITAISRFLELYDLTLFIICDIKKKTDVGKKSVRLHIINPNAILKIVFNSWKAFRLDI